MKKRNYTHVQMLLPEIKAMLAEGKTQREVAEYYGFRDKQVVKRLLERERRKEQKLEAGIRPRPKGRPRKDAAPGDVVAEQAYEIQRLRMENKLLRDFLRFTERPANESQVGISRFQVRKKATRNQTAERSKIETAVGQRGVQYEIRSAPVCLDKQLPRRSRYAGTCWQKPSCRPCKAFLRNAFCP